MLVDFLIVYDPADQGAAKDLRTALEDNGASCLLRESHGTNGTSPALSRMVSESDVVVLIVSGQGGPGFWSRPDIATIHSLLADGNEATRVVLVLASGATHGALPQDLVSATAYEAGVGWAALAADLAADRAAMAASKPRPATVMVGRSMGVFDDIWAELVAAQTGQRPDVVHGQQFAAVGDDLVVTDGGHVHRITPDQYEQSLTPGQLADVAMVEKSMEINLAEWQRVYPTRAVNANDQEIFNRVKNALADDLDRLGRVLQSSGFYLDDHYGEVRGALLSNA